MNPVTCISNRTSHKIKDKKRAKQRVANKTLVKKITENDIKLKKKDENNKKVFLLAFGCTQHQKAGLNTQQSA